MSFRPFTSESYAQGDRTEAWRDVLTAVGLQPASSGVFHDGHATASHRNAVGVALTKISAGSQGVAPLAPSVDGLPIAVLPIEDGVVLRQGASHRIIPVGHLLLLPRNGDWNVVFQRDMRAIVLSVTSEATHGRIAGKSRFGEARVVAPGGLAGVVSRMLDATARTLEALDDSEWGAASDDSCASARGARIGCGPYGDPSCDPAPDLPDHRTSAGRSRTVAGARRADGGNLRALSAKTLRRYRRQLYPLRARAAAAASLERSVQSGGSASLDF
jgi:hypothetical protein